MSNMVSSVPMIDGKMTPLFAESKKTQNKDSLVETTIHIEEASTDKLVDATMHKYEGSSIGGSARGNGDDFGGGGIDFGNMDGAGKITEQ